MADLTQQQWQAVETEILAGNKIAAIKMYREATGVGLAEAKQAVEKMESDLRQARPELFKASKARKGCAGAALALVAFLGMAMIWVISKVTG